MYGQSGYGSGGGYGQKKPETPKADDNTMLYVAGGIVALVFLSIWSQTSPHAASIGEFFSKYGTGIFLAVVVLGGLAWWGTTTTSIDEAKLALNLFGVALTIAIVLAACTFMVEKTKAQFEEMNNAFPGMKQRR